MATRTQQGRRGSGRMVTGSGTVGWFRQWFHARPEAWAGFCKRYIKELSRPEAEMALGELYRLAGRRKRLTLLFASRNVRHNNAVALKDLLEGMRKPPTGSGPGAVRTMRDRNVRRMPG
ncbi:MAG TPA: DUF488 family protein [Terriglobales bacterium]|nr:DUF488 family protein [Terriglobales bacterium]